MGYNNNYRIHFNWFEIRRIDQSLIFSTHRQEMLERLEKIDKVLAFICTERHNFERFNKSGFKPTKSDVFIGSMFENPIIGFSSVFERPKELVSLNFGGVGIYYWWNYFADDNNPMADYIGSTSLESVVKDYFNQINKKRYNIDNINLRLINFIYETQEFTPTTNNTQPLIDLINVSNINKRVESAVIDYDNSKYLCLCVPGSNIKNCFMLSLYPVSNIDNRIKKLLADIYTLICILLIVSVFTGSLLAQNFIIPIKELNRGLKALSKRDTETNISIENKDELGDLSRVFNQMMEDIKDMLLAGEMDMNAMYTIEWQKMSVETMQICLNCLMIDY